ncbi:MAG TPA: glycosyltransferase family 2 protein [Methylomirabilota bacterium]|jgi:glycosyltransferase involved in cell wall biosynthesis
MSQGCDVSVVISTYNRCDTLRGALESVLAQETGPVTYEIIVVDNNSTDGTREVVDSIIARGHRHVRYLFEGRQGLSHARNAGIAEARAPLIAFTDDDVRVASDWVANIKRAFDGHPEVDYVGGRVLPRWPTTPPTWLTRDHWSAMALSDFGDAPMYVNHEAQYCLIGANLAFRRESFDRFGLFQPDFQRVRDGIGSTEDHELQLRLWEAQRQGLYVPDLVVLAEVEPRRLSKQYHRRWHTGHGHFYAAMRVQEVEAATIRLFGVPGHLYRHGMAEAVTWLTYWVRGDRDAAFLCETRLRFLVGFVRKRRADFLATSGHGTAREIVLFVRSMAGKVGTRAKGRG